MSSLTPARHPTLGAFLERFPTASFDLEDYIHSLGCRDELSERLGSFRDLARGDARPAVTPEQLEQAARTYLSQSVPAYREYPSLKGFAQFPLLTKESLRSDPLRFCDAARNRVVWEKTSSASTGPASRCYTDAAAYFDFIHLSFRKMALVAGVACGEREVHSATLASGTPHPFQVFADPLEEVGFSLKLSIDERAPDTLSSACRLLSELQPELLVCKPTLWEALLGSVPADELRRIRPGLLVSSGSMLADDLRAALTSTFQCPLVNAYGLSEFGLIGVECRVSGGFHVDVTHIWPEVEHSVSGPRLVFSSTRNTAMPLLRFLTEDRGLLTQAPCGCALGAPRILGLQGKDVPCFWMGAAAFDPSRIASYLWTHLDIQGFEIAQVAARKMVIRLNPKSHLSESQFFEVGRSAGDMLPSGASVDVVCDSRLGAGGRYSRRAAGL